MTMALGRGLETMQQQGDITRALADKYGLTTAADLPERPKPASEDEHAGRRARWSPQKRMAFDTMSPHAVCIVATDGPVSVTLYDAQGGVTRRLGHNRGVWPAKVARSGAWRDAVTATYNKSPFVWTGTQIRCWTRSDAHARRLAEALVDHLAVMSESGVGAELINGFVDLGPDVSWEMLEMEVHALAERLGLAVWDDDGLERELERLVAKAEKGRR